MRRSMLIAAALSLVGCTTATKAPHSTTAPPPNALPDRGDTILAVANTAAAVADALDVAPPASLTRTTIDEKAIRIAYHAFDASLSVIDAYVLTGAVRPGSPHALALKRAIGITQDALNAASAAQRAGSATSYTAALERADQALADMRSALGR